jgi:hypothetical protein
MRLLVMQKGMHQDVQVDQRLDQKISGRFEVRHSQQHPNELFCDHRTMVSAGGPANAVDCPCALAIVST